MDLVQTWEIGVTGIPSWLLHHFATWSYLRGTNPHGYRAAILLQHCVFIVETIPRYNHTNRSFLSVPAAEVWPKSNSKRSEPRFDVQQRQIPTLSLFKACFSSLTSAKHNLKSIPAGVYRQLNCLKRFAIQKSRLFIHERENLKNVFWIFINMFRIPYLGKVCSQVGPEFLLWRQFENIFSHKHNFRQGW